MDDRDRDDVVNDPHSKIVAKPSDEESLAIMYVFNQTPFTYSNNGLAGFNYEALKDVLKWTGLKHSVYVSVLLSCVNYFIKGLNSKK